jgi:hypothetical protein
VSWATLSATGAATYTLPHVWHQLYPLSQSQSIRSQLELLAIHSKEDAEQEARIRELKHKQEMAERRARIRLELARQNNQAAARGGAPAHGVPTVVEVEDGLRVRQAKKPAKKIGEQTTRAIHRQQTALLARC